MPDLKFPGLCGSGLGGSVSIFVENFFLSENLFLARWTFAVWVQDFSCIFSFPFCGNSVVTQVLFTEEIWLRFFCCMGPLLFNTVVAVV